ncbi:MAG: rod shape-determining protein [Deltaproteobacteria bacterium]|nr:MAG: rod shape-determining protein [Deltaproteobacteria bacterium]
MALGLRGADVALDLGSSTVRLVGSEGVLVEQPSVVALARTARGEEVIAWGGKARDMWGRAAPNLRVVRPVEAGAVADFQATEHLLQLVFRQALGRSLRKPRVVVAVPPHCTPVERRAMLESVRAAGAREVSLASSPVLAALGAELPATEARGSLLLQVGGGRTTCAVLSLAGLVIHHTEAVGGVSMDAAIARWMQREHGLILGARSAEALKLHHGTAEGGAVRMSVRGRDVTNGGPREVAVSGDDLAEALAPLVGHIRATVLRTLAATPPELSGDIIEVGAILTGGAAQLRGLDRVLRDATDLPFLLVDHPANAVARGARTALRDPELLERITA